jgi:hypothetical protein
VPQNLKPEFPAVKMVCVFVHTNQYNLSPTPVWTDYNTHIGCSALLISRSIARSFSYNNNIGHS